MDVLKCEAQSRRATVEGGSRKRQVCVKAGDPSAGKRTKLHHAAAHSRAVASISTLAPSGRPCRGVGRSGEQSVGGPREQGVCPPVHTVQTWRTMHANVAQPATPTAASAHLDGKGGAGGRVLREVLREMRGVGTQLWGAAKRWLAQYTAAHAGPWAPGLRCKDGSSPAQHDYAQKSAHLAVHSVHSGKVAHVRLHR